MWGSYVTVSSRVPQRASSITHELSTALIRVYDRALLVPADWCSGEGDVVTIQDECMDDMCQVKEGYRYSDESINSSSFHDRPRQLWMSGFEPDFLMHFDCTYMSFHCSHDLLHKLIQPVTIVLATHSPNGQETSRATYTIT